MSMHFDPGNGDFLIVDGHVVERDALRIAEKVNEYDDRLSVICLDPNAPDVQITDAPFVVIRRKDDGSYERVLEAWTLDDRILERIWLSDGTKNNQIDILAKMEMVKKKENDDKWKAQNTENAHILASALRNPKTSYTVVNDEGERVTINDEGPMTLNGNKKSFS